MNIKEFFTENKVGKLIFSAGLGALKGVPVAGNIITELRDNKSDDLSGFGSVNIPRLSAYGSVGVIMLTLTINGIAKYAFQIDEFIPLSTLLSFII